ncbi:MAG: TIR domain-containing protein, partial [Verrucomicrobiaceae bacterium]|nr:TIR domain-containing protein [Verrucomicrobiaceae bacterium]
MIAISYRRDDSMPMAGRLYDRLQAEFGKTSVFMDFDSIPYGVDFREHITQTLEQVRAL